MEICQNCSEAVSNQFARVFGGNNGRVRVCLSCSTVGEIVRGKSALPIER